MSWWRSIFKKIPVVKKLTEYPVEVYKCCDEHTLKRQRIEDIQYGGGGMGYHRITNPAGVINLEQYCYWCSCGTQLSDGPSGGCAINAVCEKCRINYGNLPGYGL